MSVYQELDSKYQEFQLNSDFQKLKENGNSLFEKYSKPENVDKLALGRQKVQFVKMEMHTNIVKTGDHNDDLNRVEGGVREVESGANTFDKGTRDLGNELFWKRLKYAVIIVVILMIVLLMTLLAMNFPK